MIFNWLVDNICPKSNICIFLSNSFQCIQSLQITVPEIVLPTNIAPYLYQNFQVDFDCASVHIRTKIWSTIRDRHKCRYATSLQYDQITMHRHRYTSAYFCNKLKICINLYTLTSNAPHTVWWQWVLPSMQLQIFPWHND
jgi:hypothetical protein